MADYCDNQGRSVNLGRKVGDGGEGAVFEVSGRAEIVAKIYHAVPSPEHQKKLRFMTECNNEAIRQVAAWPVETIHTRNGRQMVGFMMPRATNCEPIHKLYGPAHRKHLFPDSDWAFLVHVARNLAAAFYVIHAHNHVIGDVNQGNVVVCRDGRVRLIDCDSFQIRSQGQIHHCEVGVQHFTPPELQQITSFRSVTRNANHDNFGLALLCFHLLFMGRHPFSGIYAGKGDMPLERAIRGFRFAYGADAASRGMKPPPNAVTMDIVPRGIADKFTCAFTEAGASSRPSAWDWIRAFEQLKGGLRTCSTENSHKFFGELGNCPWCGVERRTGVIFFLGRMPGNGQVGGFDLGRVWALIDSIGAPSPPALPDPQLIVTHPTPLPPEEEAKRLQSTLLRIGAACVFVAGFAFPPLLIVTVIAAVVMLCMSSRDDRERKQRQARLDAAKGRWDALKTRWNYETSGRFLAERRQLEGVRQRYHSLCGEYSRDKQKLRDGIQQKQMERFLEGYCLDDHDIPLIGPARKATLASFGIESAADIDVRRIRTIRGFGETLTQNLVNWRRSLEKQFVFDPTKGVDPADVVALEQLYRKKRQQLEAELLAGPERLRQLAAQAVQQGRTLEAEIRQAASELAQARADVAVV